MKKSLEYYKNVTEARNDFFYNIECDYKNKISPENSSNYSNRTALIHEVADNIESNQQ